MVEPEGIMPEISRFLGILIFIRYNEHNPPHFHAQSALIMLLFPSMT